MALWSEKDIYRGPNPGLSPEYNRVREVPTMELMRASMFGYSPKDLYDKLIGKGSAPTEMLLASASAGIALHMLEQAKMYAAGLIKGAERFVYDPIHKITGHIDIETNDGMIGDIKTVSNRRFRKVVHMGRPFEQHQSQVNFYLSRTNSTRGFIDYIQRTDPERKVRYKFNFDPKRLRRDLANLERVRQQIDSDVSEGVVNKSKLLFGPSLSTLRKAAKKTEGELEHWAQKIDDIKLMFLEEMDYLKSVTNRIRKNHLGDGTGQKYSVPSKDNFYNSIVGLKEQGLGWMKDHFGSGVDLIKTKFAPSGLSFMMDSRYGIEGFSEKGRAAVTRPFYSFGSGYNFEMPLILDIETTAGLGQGEIGAIWETGLHFPAGWRKWETVNLQGLDVKASFWHDKQVMRQFGGRYLYDYVKAKARGQTTHTEKQLLITLFHTIEQSKPTVLMGYNIAHFDLPYIKERAMTLGLQEEYALSKIGEIPVFDLYKMLREERGPVHDYLMKHFGQTRMPIAGSLYGETMQLPSKLEEIASAAGIKYGAHKAAQDALTTWKIYDMGTDLTPFGIDDYLNKATGLRNLSEAQGNIIRNIHTAHTNTKHLAVVTRSVLSPLLRSKKAMFGIGASLITLFGLGTYPFFEGNDGWQAVEGLPHTGFQGYNRWLNTDFGSRWKGLIASLSKSPLVSATTVVKTSNIRKLISGTMDESEAFFIAKGHSYETTFERLLDAIAVNEKGLTEGRAMLVRPIQQKTAEAIAEKAKRSGIFKAKLTKKSLVNLEYQTEAGLWEPVLEHKRLQDLLRKPKTPDKRAVDFGELTTATEARAMEDKMMKQRYQSLDEWGDEVFADQIQNSMKPTTSGPSAKMRANQRRVREAAKGLMDKDNINRSKRF